MQRHEVGGSAAIQFRLRLVGGGLLAVHLLLVAWATLRPLDVPWAASANLTPFAGIRADLAYGPLEAARRIGSSLILLAPIGVLLPLVGGRLSASPLAAWSSLARTVAAGALVSVSIGMLQTAVPGRVVDVDSVLLNAVGVALAHLAVVPALRARLRRSRKRVAARRGPATPARARSQGPTPRVTRVRIGPWTEVLSAIHREY
ncbi:VanZ family protein [Streptomyces sp. G-G2]|uniref:VanZ family protein n=1 Tax=Streptomyces sp. G-G2 TaxID=3046201 RepID=UPI0024B9540A|nr:VanZ family protein [Streptomyces sp. G-G2]MDJ0382934.1 VanZ family protein [Streptomyces sp. G-G2]